MNVHTRVGRKCALRDDFFKCMIFSEESVVKNYGKIKVQVQVGRLQCLNNIWLVTKAAINQATDVIGENSWFFPEPAWWAICLRHDECPARIFWFMYSNGTRPEQKLALTPQSNKSLKATLVSGEDF